VAGPDGGTELGQRHVAQEREDVAVEDAARLPRPLGENPGDAWANHSSSNSPTVAFLRASDPGSASATKTAGARCASRLPPRNIRYAHRFSPVIASRPRYALSSHDPGARCGSRPDPKRPDLRLSRRPQRDSNPCCRLERSNSVPLGTA
jgi:hypothetical protein